MPGVHQLQNPNMKQSNGMGWGGWEWCLVLGNKGKRCVASYVKEKQQQNIDEVKVKNPYTYHVWVLTNGDTYEPHLLVCYQGAYLFLQFLLLLFCCLFGFFFNPGTYI